MKKYTGFIFAMLIGLFSSAATYYTIPTSSWPNVGWSLTENGAPCNCGPNLNGNNNNFSDTLVIFHDIQVPNLELESGALVVIKSGATFSGAWSWMRVRNGAKIQMEAGSVLEPNVNFELEGEILGSGEIRTGWGFTVESTGSIDLSAPSFIDADDFDVNGPVSVEGNIEMSGGLSPFSESVTITADSIFVNSTNIVVNNHVDVIFNANYMMVSGGNYNPKNHSSLTFNTKVYVQNFSLTVNNHASLTFSDSVWVMNGSINGKPNSFMQFGDALYLGVNLNTKGEVQFLGVVSFNSWAQLDLNGSAEITGCGILDFSTASPWQYAGNYDINGSNNTTLSPVTFLGAVGNSACASNTVWYYNGNWSATPSSTNCSEEVVILSDLDWNSSISVGKMKVNRGVNVNVKSGATITICSDVVNNGDILVEAGGTLIVQGN
jgi:hypothetical protein